MTVPPADTAPAQAASRTRPAWGIALLLWALVVVASYYQKIWEYARGRGGVYVVLDGPREITLPYVGEAVLTALTALAGAVLLVGCAVAVGLGAQRLLRLETDSTLERIVCAASLGIGILGYLGLVLALAGLYTPLALRLVIGIIAMAALVGIARAPRKAPDVRLTLPRGVERLWAVIALAAALFALAWAFTPEHEYDAVWYHLYFPRAYLEHGRLVDLRNEYVSLYPMTWELWFGYGLAIAGAAAAKLQHYVTLPLTAGVVYLMARRLTPGASPWLAVALFGTVPTVLWDAATTYNDLALAFHIAIVLYALVRYLERRQLAWLLLAAINMGVALGVKHVALLALTLICPLLFLALWPRDQKLGAAFWPPFLLGALALLLAAPWYVRSWLGSGNPVFPEMFHLFGAPSDRWDATTDQGLEGFFAHFGRERTPRNQLALPWDMTVHSERYAGTLGPLFLALLPGLLLRREGDPRLGADARLRWVALFALGFYVLWASPLASFQMRWLLPITPVLALLAAEGASRLSQALRGETDGARNAVTVLVGTLLVLNLPPFTPLHEGDRVGWKGWLTHVIHGFPTVVLGAESRASFLTRKIATYRAWQAATHLTPDTAYVLAFSGGDHFYGHRRRIGALTPVARDVIWHPPDREDAALDGLERLGITHVILEHRFLQTNGFGDDARWSQYALTDSAARARLYETLHDDSLAVLYRIRWESLRDTTSVTHSRR